MQDDPKKPTKKLKRGRLTAEELKFLKEKGASMSVEDIALSLNRSETTIAKWLSKNKIKNEAYLIKNLVISRAIYTFIGGMLLFTHLWVFRILNPFRYYKTAKR